jgi:hypothetical protein
MIANPWFSTSALFKAWTNLSAAAVAQQVADPFPRSKAVPRELAALTERFGGVRAALGMVVGYFSPYPPTEALWSEALCRKARAAGLRHRASAGRLNGEVGNSNTQLYCQIDSHPPTHHCRVP